jgi:hypothetical protein
MDPCTRFLFGRGMSASNRSRRMLTGFWEIDKMTLLPIHMRIQNWRRSL